MLDFQIDTTSWNKANRFPQRHGYQLRGTAPTAIVIHSTSNANRGTSFTGEAKYLFESADVSAHFLVGKDGRIVRFLEPRTYQAWHVGVALDDWTNARTIGIELHTSVGETPTELQKAACAWLCQQIMREFAILAERIDTHRAVARPVGRKRDPTGWPDSEFYAWRAALTQPKMRRFRVLGIPIFEAQSLTGKIHSHLANSEEFAIDKTYSNGAGHLADQRGFIDLNHDALEEIQG